jgi:hypothetical protein
MGADSMIILKLAINKWNTTAWTEFICFTRSTNVRMLWKPPLGSTLMEHLLASLMTISFSTKTPLHRDICKLHTKDYANKLAATHIRMLVTARVGKCGHKNQTLMHYCA